MDKSLDVSSNHHNDHAGNSGGHNKAGTGTSTEGKRHVGFVFSGTGYEYFKIWIVNILLTLVTLGIYAPWAKVRNTQYFYGNTSLDGASFAFTASPVKMLIGRLIALGIFVAYLVLGQISLVASVLMAIALAFVFPWVLNRAMAFYARNTTYRNLRFRFAGSYGRALQEFLLWPILGALSLGLLVPYVLCRQQRYRVENHRYGNKSFTFSASAGSFYELCIVALLLGLLSAALGALLFTISFSMGVVGLMVGYAIGILYFVTGMHNLVYNNLSVSSHNFKARYQLAPFGWIMVSNFLLTVLTLGLFIPWAKVRLAQYAAGHVAVDVAGDLDQFAAVSQSDESAFGEEFGDVFGMEVGI